MAGWTGRWFRATGDILGSGQASSALTKGFAVLSSDAGHADTRTNPISGGVFGVDPQARIDYGYNAVASLTPMAKALIGAYYGKGPDKSYIVGTSNGGRHTMVAASRIGDQYDGYLVSAPGFNLPKAAVAQLWGAQQYAAISPLGANGRPDISKSFSVAETRLIATSRSSPNAMVSMGSSIIWLPIRPPVRTHSMLPPTFLPVVRRRPKNA